CSCTYVLHLYFSSHVFSPYFHHLSRPPPLSTLFPYTTLFRSSRVRQWRRCGRRRSGRRAEPAGGRCAGCGGGDRRSPAPPRTGRRLRSSRPPHLAEADGNRTRQTEILGLTSFEDWGAHQVLRRLHRERSSGRVAARWCVEGVGRAARGWRWMARRVVGRRERTDLARERCVVRPRPSRTLISAAISAILPCNSAFGVRGVAEGSVRGPAGRWECRGSRGRQRSGSTGRGVCRGSRGRQRSGPGRTLGMPGGPQNRAFANGEWMVAGGRHCRARECARTCR